MESLQANVAEQASPRPRAAPLVSARPRNHVSVRVFRVMADDGKRRVFIATTGDIAKSALERALGGSVASVAPVEKKDVPTDERQLWQVRHVQQQAVAAALAGVRRKLVLAPASSSYLTDDAAASAEAAEAAEGKMGSDGTTLGGLRYAEAPELPASVAISVIQALGCLYDLAPLRPGLRFVRDGMASSAEIDAALSASRRALEGAARMGERASVALTTSLVSSGQMNIAEYTVLHELRERCRRAVATAFGEAELHYSGALVTAISAKKEPAATSKANCNATIGERMVAGSRWHLPAYCHAHVDKCSILSYDVSAVLYLSDAASIDGGDFAFLDSDGVDRHVQLRAGRLLAFGSGVEHVHRVCRVESGERVALAIWFTLSRAHAQPTEEVELTAAPPAALPPAPRLAPPPAPRLAPPPAPRLAPPPAPRLAPPPPAASQVPAAAPEVSPEATPAAAPGPALADEDAIRLAIETIYDAGGLTTACFGGLGEEELKFVNVPAHGGDGAHVYGDTDAAVVATLVELVRGTAVGLDDIFVDLGSGSAKLAISMLALTSIRTAIGIELSPTRHAQAIIAHARAIESGLLPPRRAAQLQLTCGSMMDAPSDTLRRASVVFIYSLALDEPFLSRLRLLLASRLHIGALVLLRDCRRLPPPTPHENGDVDGRLDLVMETAIINTMFQYYAYRVAPFGAPPATHASVVALQQTTRRLGSSSYEVVSIGPPDVHEDAEVAAAAWAQIELDAACA